MTIPELKTKSVNELKVLAYDTMAQLEGLQQSSKIINQIISEKSQETVPGARDGKPVEPKKDAK